MEEIRAGLVGETRVTVEQAHLASTLRSGHLDVYGTPAMIALMENAAVSAVDHLLPSDSVSVGSTLDVRHLTATPPGVDVIARAELVAVDGRRLSFRLEAFDPVDKIGEGTHERFVVDRDRLVARATAKADVNE